MQNEPLRPSYLQTVLAPSSHGNRTIPSAPPSTQSLYASAMAGMSSFEAAQRKEVQDRAKLRLEAELRAEKERAAAPRDFTLPARPKQPSLIDTLFSPSFAIDCNNCNMAIANEHYHCSICDAGDFDLCQACVDSGITCDGKDHWLIKRFQRGGSIIPSVTETIAPKAKKTEELKVESAEEEQVKEEKAEVLKAGKYQGDRTCNACINGNDLSISADALTLTVFRIPWRGVCFL
jgi:next-to-BRCA1 protein 1